MADMLPDLNLKGFGNEGLYYYDLFAEYAKLSPPIIIDTSVAIQWQITRIQLPGDSVRMGEWPTGPLPAEGVNYGQAIKYLEVVNQNAGTNPMHACARYDFSVNGSYI